MYVLSLKSNVKNFKFKSTFYNKNNKCFTKIKNYCFGCIVEP